MIGAVIAMDSEAKILREVMDVTEITTSFGKCISIGNAFGKDILLIVCGVGKVNAAAGACAALRAGADVILNFGVAGGLNEDTEVGNVYLIEKAVQYDFDLTQLNGGSVGTLDGREDNYFNLSVPVSLSEGLNLPLRSLGSGDRFNDSPQDHALLLSLGADIRDMEGAAIAEVCEGAGIPLVSVKAISDVYGAGSTTEQFKSNLARAMENLKACLAEIVRGL